MPKIILKDVFRSLESEGTSEDNEVNDFDFVGLGETRYKMCVSFDSGESRIYEFDSSS